MKIETKHALCFAVAASLEWSFSISLPLEVLTSNFAVKRSLIKEFWSL